MWLIIQGGFEYFAGWLRARSQAKAYSFALSWRSIFGLITAIALLKLGYQGGEFVILGAVGATFVAMLILPRIALLSDHNQPVSMGGDTPFKTVLQYGIPVAFSNLIITGLSLLDRFFISAQMGTESVAIYSANYDLAEKTIFFANSMLLLSSSVIGFRIFEQEGESKAADFLSRLMRLYLLAALPLIVGLVILSPYIIAILLPAKYAEGALVLPVVAVGGLFVGIMHRYSLLLSFHKRTDIIMWCSAGALLVNLLSCYLLIPQFGLVGAASSTLLAYAIWFLLIRAAAMQYRGPIFPWITLIRVCVALVGGAGGMYAIIFAKFSIGLFMLLASFVAGLIAYVILLFLLGEVSRKEVIAIIDVFSNRFRKV